MIKAIVVKSRYLLVTLLLAAALMPAGATNSDVAKESRWAEQVIEGLLDGDELWLIDDSGHEFLGIVTEGDRNSGRAVILAHGIGVHPNWPDVIYPLRAGLLEQQITTLSLQMPILPNDADEREYALLFSEVPGRFEAALDYLDGNGYKKVVIIGHSMGAAMANYYLSRNDPDEIVSLVIIGMGAEDAFPESVEVLAKVGKPVLDLYGSEDLEQVLSSAKQRATSGKSRKDLEYLQVRVEGANHFFQGHEDALLRHVIEWLENH